MEKIDELLHSIWESVPQLVDTEEILDFDEGSGFRRSGIIRIPHPPQLNHVLTWWRLGERSKWSHFECGSSGCHFVVWDSEESYTVEWDLSKDLLTEQDPEVWDWLWELI
jgi:hypothetical protein